MDATLNLYTKLLAFTDSNNNSNPRLRPVDWDRETAGISVKNSGSAPYEIPVAASKLIFDGARSTTIDSSTVFSIALLPSNTASLYRITYTAGTSPGFRTDRGLTLNSSVLTFSVMNNNIVNVSVPSLSPGDFASVQAGDIVFIPGPTTGDVASPINVLNCGYWQVLAKTDAENIVLSRLAGEVFEGASETIVLTDNSQFLAFSPSGVQVGDTVTISSGFSIATQKSFEVTAVTSKFIEFVSTLPLPNQTAIQPGTNGMSFYTNNKRLLYIEADQECVVRINGDTGDFQRLGPIEPGNTARPGIYLKWGNVFSLTVVNKSTSTLNLLVITAE